MVYPGLKSYEQYELAQRQTDGPGAMISIYIKGGLPFAGAFLSRLKVSHHRHSLHHKNNYINIMHTYTQIIEHQLCLQLFGLAVSLGAVESLACSPAIMTHASVPQADRERVGLTDGLVRLSIGLSLSL